MGLWQKLIQSEERLTRSMPRKSWKNQVFKRWDDEREAFNWFESVAQELQLHFQLVWITSSIGLKVSRKSYNYIWIETKFGSCLAFLCCFVCSCSTLYYVLYSFSTVLFSTLCYYIVSPQCLAFLWCFTCSCSTLFNMLFSTLCFSSLCYFIVSLQCSNCFSPLC